MTTADASENRSFTAKGLATRERILRAAAEVLLAEGLTAFNLDKVRQAASVSGSQLNHYFVDRQDLVRAVVARQVEIVLQFHRQPRLGGLDTFEDWEQWAALNLRYLRRVGYRGNATYHALAAQLAKSDAATRETFADGYWRWVTLLEDSFARMKSHGLLTRSADPRQMALVVVGLHQGAGLLAFTFRQEWPLADVTRFVVNYVRLQAKDPGEHSPRPPRKSRPRRRPRRDEPGEVPRFTAKGMATRERIIEGAGELVFDHGVNGTSLDDVRRAVGVSGSQISHYFTDKLDLVRRVIEARTNVVVAFHTQDALGGLDTFDSIRAWADLCCAQAAGQYLRGGCVYGSLTGELLEADDVVLDDLADGYERWLRIFEGGLTAMSERGDVGTDADPRHLAVAFVAAHQGGALLTHVTGSVEPFRTAVTAALDYVASFRTRRRS
ncbi:TetR/AcrR family transcriptional regulator [Mycobacterium sp. NPDC006124]|uniref:TetR/AcrR family transcriptional regulator n=1 Tax=Mycobacterium sp. NPDC006124 TaxID=3156729 RepID=UPI0033B91EA5